MLWTGVTERRDRAEQQRQQGAPPTAAPPPPELGWQGKSGVGMEKGDKALRYTHKCQTAPRKATHTHTAGQASRCAAVAAWLGSGNSAAGMGWQEGARGVR